MNRLKRFCFAATLLSAAMLFCTALFAQPNLAAVPLPTFKKDSFNIKKFGAVADGIALNTQNIQKAIDACTKKGGGVVVIPAGMWLTGPIELKSNVNLHLAKNAILLFTADKSQYQLVETNWEGLRAVRNQSPVWAINAHNIAITGFGIIDGNGDGWRMVKKDKLTETNWNKMVTSGGVLSDDKKTWYPSAQSLEGSKQKDPGVMGAGKVVGDYQAIKDYLRPNLLVLNGCKKILLEGVIFQNSPAWCLHPIMSQDITIRNISVKNPWYAQNGDGLDLESCKNVLIENSVFDVGDDGICIKSGRDEQGRKRNMPTENVMIRNCIVYHAHGGFVVGSEMSGGARNIVVKDCSFIGTDIGIRFKKNKARGGLIVNIDISNITMKDIAAEAILFDMYYAAKDPVPLAGEKREPPKVETLPVDETTPIFRKIMIRNVVCVGAEKAIYVRGLPEMNVRDIVMQDMVLQAKQGLDMTEGSDITLKNVELITEETDKVLSVHNSQNITFDNISYTKNADVLLGISGDKSKAIKLINTNAGAAKKKATFEFGASSKSLEEK